MLNTSKYCIHNIREIRNAKEMDTVAVKCPYIKSLILVSEKKTLGKKLKLSKTLL